MSMTRKVSEIKEQLGTKDDIIQFMYDNVVAQAEEYTNWDARQAVREIMQERYGTDLESQEETVMTNKFLLFDLNHGAFLEYEDGRRGEVGLDMQKATLFTEQTAKEAGLEFADESKFLQIPMTKDFVDSLPFDLKDSAPETPHSKTMDTASALKGDFVVLTEFGFVDEKYNSSTNTSRPKARGFELDYANLYNQGKLEELGTDYILKAGGVSDPEPIIIPVSELQQEKLKLLPDFSPEREPHGFFMEPIGETRAKETMPELGDALDALQEASGAVELPWN